jgi:hypothetical protein
MSCERNSKSAGFDELPTGMPRPLPVPSQLGPTGKPVAAIVPGYGLAGVVQQALGGWFGFEMYSYWIKTSSHG